MGVVEEIKARVNLVDLIGRYVVLKPAGKNYKARCPFHPDDTPSLVVSPEKGLWHCFGCGAGGDAIGFIMRIERLSFPEALQKLSQELGIELRPVSAGKTRLFQVNLEALRFFQRELGGPAGEKARAYLLSRGIDQTLWGKWGLGYAPASWDGLLRSLSRFGVQTLLALGLIIMGERGPYDRFRDRLIFSIWDEQGRVVAFAGRAFDSEPKYLNTPNISLFTKGTILYGLNFAKDALRRGRAVLVEGYTDVISLHAAGITEAVASMGTSLTAEQARLLSRYTQEVVVAYDQDAAGEASALRGMFILHGAGLRVRVASFPPGEDPDSFVRKAGGKAVEEILAQAQPLPEFFVNALARRHDLSSLAGREAILREAQTFWPELKSSVLKMAIVTGLSHLLGLAPEEIQEALRGVARPVSRSEERGESFLTPEDLVVKFLVEGKVPISAVSELLAEERRFSGVYREVVRRWAELKAAGEPPDPTTLVFGLSPQAAARVSHLLLLDLKLKDENQALEEALRRFLYLPRLMERMETVKSALQEAEKRGDSESVRQLALEFQHLCRERFELLRR